MIRISAALALLLPVGCALPPNYTWGLPAAYEPPRPAFVTVLPDGTPLAPTPPAPPPPQLGAEQQQKNLDALMANGGRERSLSLQRNRDAVDWWNQQTGTLRQCSGPYCW